MSAPEKPPYRLRARLDAALDEGGLAAAPAVQGGIELLAERAEIPVRTAGGVLIDLPLPGKDGTAPAAACLDRAAELPQGFRRQGRFPLRRENWRFR